MSKNINKILAAPFAVAVLIIAAWHYGYLGRLNQQAVFFLTKTGPQPPHKYAYDKNVNSLPKQHVNFQPKSIQSDITVVSAFYGINRVGRPSSEYLN
jgi:type IV secretory pathway protease TraF